MGNHGHFNAFLFEAKPHPGIIESAANVRMLLEGSELTHDAEEIVPLDGAGFRELTRSVQDKYSIRCAPHITGALRDTLEWVEKWVEIEINSSDDNPLFDAGAGRVQSGGNFYGSHMTQGMDALKIALANMCDLIDRQLELVVDEKFNAGLTPNLIPYFEPTDSEAGLHHGFKGMQLSCSALTAEALKLCNPASIHSRSTEAHNQDKVSMGTIAARDARSIVEIAAAHRRDPPDRARAGTRPARGRAGQPEGPRGARAGPRARRVPRRATGAWTATSPPSSSSSAPASCAASWRRRGCAGRPSSARVGPVRYAVLRRHSPALAAVGEQRQRRAVHRSAPGSKPGVAVDAAGTAYIAWNGPESRDTPPHFCRLPRGATACDVALTLPIAAGTTRSSRPFVRVRGRARHGSLHAPLRRSAPRSPAFTSRRRTAATPSTPARSRRRDVPFDEAVAGPGRHDRRSRRTRRRPRRRRARTCRSPAGSAGAARARCSTPPARTTARSGSTARRRWRSSPTGVGDARVPALHRRGRPQRRGELGRAGRDRLRRLSAARGRARRAVRARRRRRAAGCSCAAGTARRFAAPVTIAGRGDASEIGPVPGRRPGACTPSTRASTRRATTWSTRSPTTA